MDAVGQQIKGYEIQEFISSGAFGSVYRATQSFQPTFKREVAIKIIHPQYANQHEFIRSFEAEAQLVARLEHHHIVPLYDYWRDPNGAYLVMRWFRGGSLYDLMKSQGALDLEEVSTVFSQITSALHIAHTNQIIHRDIKPANILLNEYGDASLADFGIAKDHTMMSNGTKAGDMKGTPNYMSPEQIRGETVTPQTDIYSLGLLLYEMLVGEHPFPVPELVEILYKQLDEPIPELKNIDENICDALNTVIQKATAKNPDQRFSNVIEFVQAFHKAIALDALPAPASVIELLTPREHEVLSYIILGKSNREIADEMI